MSLPKELTSNVIIRFQDCDPFGHLNSARYIDYFFNARTDHLMTYYGFNIFQPGQTESWVVMKAQLAYLEPALLMEEVVIHTRLIHLTNRTLMVEGRMLDKDSRRLKAVSWVEFMYVSLATGRPSTHSEDLQNFLAGVVVDEPINVHDFNGRVQALREQFRQKKLQPA